MKTFETYAEKRKKALDILVSLGAVKYVKDIETYHGRSSDGTKWEVNPGFNNGGNATGNQNVNAINALNTADKDIASKYAELRTQQNKNAKQEIIKIEALDDDSVVFDRHFDASKLSQQQLEQYYQALDVLTNFEITEAKPVKLEFKKAWDIVVFAISKLLNNPKLFPDRDPLGLISIVDETKLKKELANNSYYWSMLQRISGFTKEDLLEMITDYISAHNTQILLKIAPNTAFRAYLHNDSYCAVNGIVIHFSSTFFSAWAANNHIIGSEQNIHSPNINKDFKSIAFFDTTKILTQQGHGEMMQQCIKTYGKLTTNLINITDYEISEFLINANSREIMEFICQSPACKNLFEKDSGIHEGWTVGQHTQSVLDFFDKYYQNDFPNNLKPFLKIVMLAHDIGKGYAYENNLPQHIGNLQQTKTLYDALNITNEYRELINFIVHDSQIITTRMIEKIGRPKPNIDAELANLKAACIIAFTNAFNRPPDINEIEGLAQICIALQTCDSGSYTRYASIQEENKIVGGGNDRFTASFILDEKHRPRLKGIDEGKSIN